MNEKIPATVEILTHNSAATLPRALESVREFSEVIIVDGRSADDTRAIAAQYGARIIEQPAAALDPEGRISDFAGARNAGLAAATQPWFFFLDSDEYASADLLAQIRSIIAAGKEGGYFVRRKYVIDGVVMDAAYSYPNRSMRFFARESAERFIKRVHERIKLREDSPVGELQGPLLVPLPADHRAGRAKGDQYRAVQLAQEGEMSWGALFSSTLDTLRALVSYTLREIVVLLFARGTRLPFAYYLETQRYHVRMLAAFWQAKFYAKHH